MLNILWVEDQATDEKKNQWFKDRPVQLVTDFSQAEQKIKSTLSQYDIVVLDLNLEDSEKTESIEKYAKAFGLTSMEFLERSGINLYFMLLEYGFPKERIVFLTANANNQTCKINELKQSYDRGDDDGFKKVLEDITKNLSDGEKSETFQFLEKPDGYAEDDLNALCHFLESLFDKVNEGESKNTYEELRKAARDCRINDVPLACLKGTNQLDNELKKHEANNYLVLRRGIIDGCDYLTSYIDDDESNIQFRDFIKIENNSPTIEIPPTEIKNYLEALSICLPIKLPDFEQLTNLYYRQLLRTLAHEWEENVDAKSFQARHGGDLTKIHDIYTFAWLMKMTRNWVSHANLLEPLTPKFIAFVFLLNMRAMFKLPNETQAYERKLLKLLDVPLTLEMTVDNIKNNIDYAEKLVDEHIATLRIVSDHKHFGEKINAIYRHVTGNPDAEKYEFKQFLFQYFWVNHKKESNLRSLVAKSDEFLPTLARQIFTVSFQ